MPHDRQTISLILSLSRAETFSLAAFAKRITMHAVREVAADEPEAQRMIAALAEIQQTLSDQGYSPCR